MLSALAMLAANEQTDSILFAAPFGLAWAFAGLVLIGEHHTLLRDHPPVG
jgi:hypothetical protein